MASSSELPRVLFVDDEQRVLDGIRRHLRKDFDLTLASGGQKALEAVRQGPPFAVVVSDLNMPGMDGITLLSRLRDKAPETVRVLLTGNADVRAAVKAVNEGELFRFLTKPCPADELAKAVRSAVDHHRLITAEKELLEKTLQGSIQMLSDVLALSDPVAFGRATRLKRLSGELAAELGLKVRWHVEVAALLAEIGSIALPDETLERLRKGEELSEAEQAQVDRVPEITHQLVSHIPRLESVRDALAYQGKRFDGSGTPADGVAGDQIPIGARILRLTRDFDELEEKGLETTEALAELESREGWYDRECLAALRTLRDAEDAGRARELSLDELRVGMVFLEDCASASGRLLVARGNEVTSSVLARLQNFADNEGVREPIRVREAAADPSKGDAIG